MHGRKPVSDGHLVSRLHVYLEAYAQIRLLIHVCAPAAERDNPLPEHHGCDLENGAPAHRHHVGSLGSGLESGRCIDHARISPLGFHEADQPLERGPRVEGRLDTRQGSLLSDRRLREAQHFGSLELHHRTQVGRPLAPEA